MLLQREGVRKFALVYALLLAFVSYGALAMFSEGVVLPGWPFVAMLSALTLVDYLLKSYRWQVLLGHYGMHISFREAVKTYVAGLMFIVTPAKAGTVVKAQLMKKRHGFSRKRTAFLAVVERAFDMVAHLVIAGMAALFVASQYAQSIGAAAVVIALGVAGLYVFRHKLSFVRQEMEELRDLRLVVRSLVLSVVSWALEAFEVWLAVLYFGGAVTVPQAFFAFSGSLILGNITLMPGGLGATEASLVGLLVLFAVSNAVAASTTMLIRFTTLWLGFLLGTAMWFLSFHGKT